MFRISRRKMLVGSAILGTARSGAGIAGEPARDLTALIEAHKAAYADFMTSIRPSHAHNDHAACSRAEEKALLAVCVFPAANDPDRRAKATYLLAIEARGELDLRRHMQAVLLSML
jgi:hypothetical protein